ncbi:MAG: 6,7-dimethyl-8-ribityllumazine synthase [Acidobacteriaceae bacterium]|jgi:6,7-dimethyl-8-ribityllumazine synthase
MIRGITVTECVGPTSKADRLAAFFAALGIEPDPTSLHGHAFLLPCTRFELAESDPNRQADLDACASRAICIDVTSLDSVRSLAQAWVQQYGEGGELTDIVETDRDSRSFTAAPVTGVSIQFREWSDPLRNRPSALEGELSAAGMRFAIVVARWNAVITDRLLQGCLDALCRSGTKRADVVIVRVPGAWEIPSAARKAAELGRFDAVITLGLLLRGETAHYEAIYNEVARGIGQSQQETGIPHAFGVLTCETLEQALDRAGLKAGNKGFEAALAAIEMISLHRRLSVSPGEILQRV